MRRTLVAVFDHEQDLLNAVRVSRREGLKIIDVFTPYAVHGLERELGWGPSKLPWVCFLLGLTGAALKVWFEFWTTAVDWPVNVGGKPFNSLPAFVPVTFEVMVLFAGMSSVLALVFVAKLYPGKSPVLPVPGVTDDRFALLVERADAAFDTAAATQLLRDVGAVEVEERAEAEAEVR